MLPNSVPPPLSDAWDSASTKKTARAATPRRVRAIANAAFWTPIARSASAKTRMNARRRGYLMRIATASAVEGWFGQAALANARRVLSGVVGNA